MITLRSNNLLLRLDPRHGGSVLDLINLVDGRQLLGRPPFESSESTAGELDELTWTKSYRGGWQLLTPNAGDQCVVNGVTHGFHGRASCDPWIVSNFGDSTATLTWSGHNLKVDRMFTVQGDKAEVEVNITSLAEHVPLIAVEHIAFGIELLDPEVSIDLPKAEAFEIDDFSKSIPRPSVRSFWPNVTLSDGQVERSDCWSLKQNRSRLICLTNLSVGIAEIRNKPRGIGVEITWDIDWLRHLWIWHEVRLTGGLWRKQTELLILEPATTPHSFGLSRAIADGFATFLEKGESRRYRISIRPFHKIQQTAPADLVGNAEYV